MMSRRRTCPKRRRAWSASQGLARWAQQAHAASIIDEGSVAASHKSMKSSQREDDISHVTACPDPTTCARCLFLRQKEHWCEAGLCYIHDENLVRERS